MKKLIFNFYLLVILALIAQAIFVVFTSNTTIADSLKVKKIQAENQQINDRLSVLEDKITQSQAINHLTGQAVNQDFVSIDKRQLVAKQTLASLP